MKHSFFLQVGQRMSYFFRSTRKVIVGLGLAGAGAAVVAFIGLNDVKALTNGPQNNLYSVPGMYSVISS